MKMEDLKKSLTKIDELIAMAKKDKTIDVNDLRKERNNCVLAIKKLRKSEESL